MRKVKIILLMGSLMLISCISACHSQGTLSLFSYSKKAGVGYSVYVSDGYAYITNNNGVVIFDVHQPKRPRKVGKITTGVTFGICIEKDLAYISAESGLVIADVRDPVNPKILTEYAFVNETQGVQVEGSYVYIASERGLEILNISNPGKVIPIAHIGDSPIIRDVDVYDGIAYLASPGNGVEVIDVTDPVSPQKITTVAGTKGAWGFHIHNEFLYVGCHGYGVKILSLSDKKSPRIIGSFRDNDGGEALGVWGDGKHLYIADNYNIEVLDVSDPTNPYEISEYSKVIGAHDLCVDGKFIYVAEAKKGLIIFEVKQEQRR